MARDDAYKSQGLGPILVARAFAAALEISELSGSVALLVYAKNDDLVAWYESLGFTRLAEQPRSLFITNQTMADYIERLRLAIAKIQ